MISLSQPPKDRALSGSGQPHVHLGVEPLYGFLSKIEKEYGIRRAEVGVINQIRDAVKNAKGCPFTAGKNLIGRAKLYAQYAVGRQKQLADLNELVDETERLLGPGGGVGRVPILFANSVFYYNDLLPARLVPLAKEISQSLFPDKLASATEAEFCVSASVLTSKYKGEIRNLFVDALQSALVRSWRFAILMLSNLTEDEANKPIILDAIEGSVKTFNRILSSRTIVHVTLLKALFSAQLEKYLQRENDPESYQGAGDFLIFERIRKGGVLELHPFLTKAGQEEMHRNMESYLAQHYSPNIFAQPSLGCPIRFLSPQHKVSDNVSRLAMLILRESLLSQGDRR